MIGTELPLKYLAYLCTDCKTTSAALDYAGELDTTSSGASCVRWDTTSTTFEPNQFPDASLEDAANFCRNPDRKAEGVWCFTDHSTGEWEYCDLPFCTGKCPWAIENLSLGQTVWFISDYPPLEKRKTSLFPTVHQSFNMKTHLMASQAHKRDEVFFPAYDTSTPKVSDSLSYSWGLHVYCYYCCEIFSQNIVHFICFIWAWKLTSLDLYIFLKATRKPLFKYTVMSVL